MVKTIEACQKWQARMQRWRSGRTRTTRNRVYPHKGNKGSNPFLCARKAPFSGAFFVFHGSMRNFDIQIFGKCLSCGQEMGVEPKFNIKISKAKEGFAVFFGKLYKSCKTCNDWIKKTCK